MNPGSIFRSSLIPEVTVEPLRLVISDTFIQAGHLYSAATVSEISLGETRPANLAPSIDDTDRPHLFLAQV
jgi:hypothetical protein